MSTIEDIPNRKQLNEQEIFDLFVDFLESEEDLSPGVLVLEFSSGDSIEVSKVPCFLSLQMASEDKSPGAPLPLPVERRSERVPEGIFSAKLFLETLQNEILSRLKAMDRTGRDQ